MIQHKALTTDQIRAFRADTRKKMLHEKKLQRNLNRWGRNVFIEIERDIAIDKAPAITSENEEKLMVILNDHYIDTANDFAKFDLKKYIDGSVDEENEVKVEVILAIAAILLNMISVIGPFRLKEIIKTTVKDIHLAISEAKKLLAEQIIAPTSKQIANITAKILNNKWRARAGNISITETNWISEATRNISTRKATEAINRELSKLNFSLQDGKVDIARLNLANSKASQSLSYSESSKETIRDASEDIRQERPKKKARVVVLFKTWLTMQDNRVRDSHKAALGQRVPFDKPFQVGQSLLMYPGDTSLGAALKEIIRCRCWVSY